MRRRHNATDKVSVDKQQPIPAQTPTVQVNFSIRCLATVSIQIKKDTSTSLPYPQEKPAEKYVPII